MITINIDDKISPALARLARNATSMAPAMQKIESRILKPLRLSALGSSGITPRTGELFAAVDTWSGRVSAGITLRSKPGKDLIIPKASTMMKGAQKNSYGRRRKKQWTVKAYSRTTASGTFTVQRHSKSKGPLPWGNIPARPFFPKEQQLVGRMADISAIISEHLTANV